MEEQAKVAALACAHFSISSATSTLRMPSENRMMKKMIFPPPLEMSVQGERNERNEANSNNGITHSQSVPIIGSRRAAADSFVSKPNLVDRLFVQPELRCEKITLFYQCMPT